MKQVVVGCVFGLLGAALAAALLFLPGQRTIEQRNPVVFSPPARPTPAEAKPVVLGFVGDVMLARSVGVLMAEKQDWEWPFRQIATTTAEPDLMFANLETTISTRGRLNGCGFCFRSDPRVVQGLVAAGFDVLSVANNHIWDYGPEAFADTLGYLASASISPVGGGANAAVAHAGVVREVRGTQIAYLAYTDILPASANATAGRTGVSLYDSQTMVADIAAARQRSDVVIVSFHTGTEYVLTHNPKQEQIYQAAIEAGADLVVGTHPHVVQEVLSYKQGWIAYSLGNFIFDQNFSLSTRRGLMLKVEINAKKISQVTSIPVYISTEYQPALTPN